MRKYIFIGITSLLLFSCKKEEKPAAPVAPEMSEMSVLMLQMYEENEKVRQKILKGEDLSDYPEEFLKIHTASLTDPADRNEKFKLFSDVYLSSLKSVFETPKDSLKDSFNQSINSCIACHQNFCPGPIPRIQKLLIR
jgi:hypothetical protein